MEACSHKKLRSTFQSQVERAKQIFQLNDGFCRQPGRDASSIEDTLHQSKLSAKITPFHGKQGFPWKANGTHLSY